MRPLEVLLGEYLNFQQVSITMRANPRKRKRKSEDLLEY